MTIKACNKIIEYSFYTLFFLVPLVFWKDTSELFELNKMWLVWALTIIISMSWFIKMTIQRRILFCRTPLDIPIGLFLLSQIISTIFSLDPHVSLWGYYSRFNGGLLSIMSYVLLYYAFVSNFVINNTDHAHEKHESVREFRKNIRDFSEINAIKMVKRLLFVSLISGMVVALWGLPSHFGYDPTCFLFRGTLDVSCWTADFLPRVRIFSTLGQPDWLAAYLAILIPISIAFFMNNPKSNSSSSQRMNHESGIVNYVLSKKLIHYSLFIILYSLFYIDLLFTRARSGILGIWLALIFFFGFYFWMERKKIKSLILNRGSLIIIGSLLLITFLIGTPFNQLHRFTLDGIKGYFQKVQAPKAIIPSGESGGLARRSPPKADEGGTESGNIRLNVWNGAISAWRANPLFGTGVETFAFAYYKYKPAGQNLTSEWNFLYNKAHNEYLNFLATTGIFGLGSYLLMIGSFFFISFKKLKTQMSKLKGETQNEKLSALSYNFELCILSFALVASYVSILITNFFGFSVVITNVYLFMIPAFVFVLTGVIKDESRIINHESRIMAVSLYRWTGILFIILAVLFMILQLFRFWQADMAYALGYNLNRAGEYQQAYPNLQKAVKIRGSEPVFKDELSVNNAIIAAGLLSGDEKTQKENIPIASSLATEAINLSNEVISKHPNNAVFWKTRVRLFFTLSQVDSRYLSRALDAIEKASLLAPNDANILYNLGVLYGQNDNLDKGISALEKTVNLKPDYRDAHYALGLFYHQKADPALQKKAVAQMQYILDSISPNDPGAIESIKSWR